MPELPEVEYTARQLRSSIVGATIKRALVFWERTIGYPDLDTFLVEVSERRIEAVRRRGQRFRRHATVRVLFQAGVQDRIGYLVGYFVRMAFGH